MDINSISGARSDISEMISKIRELSNKNNIFADTNKVGQPSGFEEVLSMTKNAVSNVNDLQQESSALKAAYVTGDSNVSMSQIIVASQKSKLAFEGLLAVRNKILDAYKEIMNMPI